MPNPKLSIPYPSRRNDERRREKANNQIEKFYEIFKDLSFNKFASSECFNSYAKFSRLLSFNWEIKKINEMALGRLLNGFCDFLGMDECLALADLCATLSMPLSVWKKASSSRSSLLLVMTIELAGPCDYLNDRVVKSLQASHGLKLLRHQVVLSPEFSSLKILIEEDYKPAVQHQRRVNPKIHDVIKKEVEKLLDAGLIYPISDSPWV
ncbi:hypothetical protein Tco_0454741 [Tanacetum coccineum]